MTKKNNLFAIGLITSLFFLWGFAHNLDPILIPHLKRSFTLSTLQATLVDSAVFIAYFIMAIPAGIIMKKYSYKAGIIIGLLMFATGSFLFVPAANNQSYPFFLIALFIIACGLTTLETAANPYITVLGPPESAPFRLNFAQSFNGLAATMAPIIGARIILAEGATDEQLSQMSEAVKQATLAAEASTVKTPYIVLGTLLILVAVLFAFTKLPSIEHDDEKPASKNIFQALRHKHLAWGVAAQFFYVGAQVCVFSLFILYAQASSGITDKQASIYLGACGFAFLAGRFLGTILMKFFKAERLLTLYATINTILCILAASMSGMVTIYIVIAICFFMSIMFPTIFALGIKGLGKDTAFGSSLIIMSIVGGAIFPPIFGYISDVSHNIQLGYFVPMICFIVIAMFGLGGAKTTKKEVEIEPAGIL
nr:L-fucose:H+ symporter permease [uncultured Pedobacter sp.]